MLIKFSEKTGKGKVVHFTRKIKETRNTDQRHANDRPKHACTENSVTTVTELALSHAGRPDTNTWFNIGYQIS